jgi:DNA ligase-associated metallophosphoesterase
MITSMQTAHSLFDQTFWLSLERTMYWEEKKTLVVADLHLGKTGHFRRAGIAVPQSVYKADLQRLISVIFLCKAERMIIVGDMTHSANNRELDLFIKWRKDFSSLQVDLVKGNHDILEDNWYSDASVTLHQEELIEDGFCFRHGDVEEKKTSDHLYTFSGHVHPGIILRGQAKQQMRLPCFYFGHKQGILPAFSHFSGTYTVNPEQGETVYALAGKELVRF